MRRRTFLIGSLAAAAVAGTATACAPGSGNGGGGGEASGGASTPSGEVTTDIASLGDITLVVWDQEVRGGQKAMLDDLNAQFMEKYPNVTIDRVSRSFDDLKATIALALSGNDVPDVAQINNARADMGEFVKAGQLLNLEPYAEAYGWADRFPATILAKTRYSSDAVSFGDGDLFGMPQTGEIVGIFYSAAKLAELGIEVPKTWDEYLAALETAKAAGATPMLLGNIDKWPAIHVFGPVQGAYVAPDEILALGMGNAGASWTSDENLQAAELVAKWGTEGYLGASPNGEDYDAAWAAFAEGGAAFLPAGSWLAADLADKMGGDVHFMAPPPVEAGGKLATTGGTGIPFSIPAKAKNAAAAAAYIDFITTNDAMEVIAKNGNMPVLDASKYAAESPVLDEIYAAFEEVSSNGSLLPYLDYATPTFSDTLGNELQNLIAGQQPPATVLEALQADYEAFTS